MPIEGEISIVVIVENDKINTLQIDSSRPSKITELFVGKSIQQVENSLNLLYQLCNVAHRFGFLQLLNKSGIVKLSDNELSAYQLLLDIETVKEHCFSIASKWQESNTIDKAVTPVLTTLNSIRQHLFANGDGLSLEDKRLNSFSVVAPFIDDLDKQLHDFLLGGGYREHTVFSDVNAFNQWIQAEKTHSAVFLHTLQQQNLTNLGTTNTRFLPLLSAKEIGTLLKDESFICKPNYQNIIYESTPISRLKTHTLVKALGSGIMGRYSAQLVEIFALLSRIQQNYKNIQLEDICYKTNVSNLNSSALVCVEAARGKLFHQANIKNNHIVDYQILSPTQWNFHPQGVLREMIKTLNFHDKDDLRRRIALLVNSLDPCVGCNIKVNYA